ncbi:MAG: hypothetical protein ACYTFG_05730 [Planctomycetota bacterium]|jgi:hypothetical protein
MSKSPIEQLYETETALEGADPRPRILGNIVFKLGLTETLFTAVTLAALRLNLATGVFFLLYVVAGFFALLFAFLFTIGPALDMVIERRLTKNGVFSLFGLALCAGSYFLFFHMVNHTRLVWS